MLGFVFFILETSFSETGLYELFANVTSATLPRVFTFLDLKEENII